MEKFNIGYSTKNIPLPSQNDFLQRLIEKTKQFLLRMRWKAYFFLNPSTSTASKDTYGFKSTKNTHDRWTKRFNKLKDNTERIKNGTKLLIAAYKTNIYKLEPSR